jgi:predicted transglutaminase-like cysteine proteinase
MTTKTVIGFDRSGGLPLMAMHTFFAGADGQLMHEIDGRLRATVPPEGWADYVKDWPEAADIVSALTKPATPTPSLEQLLQQVADNAVNAALKTANQEGADHVVA